MSFLRFASRFLISAALRVTQLVGKSPGVQPNGCDQCEEECQLFHLDSMGEYDDSTAPGWMAIRRNTEALPEGYAFCASGRRWVCGLTTPIPFHRTVFSSSFCVRLGAGL